MDLKKPNDAIEKQAKNFQNSSQSSGVGEAASTLLNDGKRVASELYEEGKSKMQEAKDNIKEYSDEIANQVQNKPLLSLLVAGGVGFILASLLRR